MNLTELLSVLHERFGAHPDRHPNVNWSDIEERIKAQPTLQQTLIQMEESGGAPDLIASDSSPFECPVFVDLSKETPKGRISLCYDKEARENRKKFPPESSAEDHAHVVGVKLLTPEQYRYIQQFGPFDQKTSSWVKTPDNIRQLGGALFGDNRYGTTFIYHNGAESYYKSRGYRGYVELK